MKEWPPEYRESYWWDDFLLSIFHFLYIFIMFYLILHPFILLFLSCSIHVNVLYIITAFCSMVEVLLKIWIYWWIYMVLLYLGDYVIWVAFVVILYWFTDWCSFLWYFDSVAANWRNPCVSLCIAGLFNCLWIVLYVIGIQLSKTAGLIFLPWGGWTLYLKLLFILLIVC